MDKLKQLNVSISQELYKELAVFCAINQETKTAVVTEAIKKALERGK